MNKPILIAAALSASLPLHAGTTTIPAGPEPVMTTTTDSGWQLTLGLYGWVAGLNGDLGAAGFIVPVDLSFSDILDTLDMTAMGMVEVNKGPWMFQLEGLYLRNSVKGLLATTPVLNRPLSAKLTAETTRLEGIVGYRLVDRDTTSLDLFAGVVYYNIENSLDFYGPLAVRGVEGGDDWFDPMIGFRLRQQLGGPWSAQIRGDVGGFGVNADIAWQAVALLGYQLNPSSTAYVGWRHAAVDYRNGGFVYDVYSTGPILGVAFSW
ncbi:hypothetical protein [Haloferula sp. A504]|uniref:hypothetical protein n=1 Tax=Haloferula sp. A504 TaxID=3373601 RepID=UPI0031BF281C|nr:hypothetical protein [Verrucomicrobiaceae bacterium E54]